MSQARRRERERERERARIKIDRARRGIQREMGKNDKGDTRNGTKMNHKQHKKRLLFED